MADENNAPAKQGATPEDVSEHYSAQGNPAPEAPPSKKPEEPKKEDEKPAAEAEEESPPSVEQSGDEADEGPDVNAPLDEEVWGSTGNEAGDSVLTVLQNSGIDPEDAKALMYDAMLEGKPENIDRAALAEKIGEANANLVMIGVRQFLADSTAKAEAINTTVYDAVGGQENWDAVTTWAREAVDEADLQTYRSMIDAGGVQAKLAAQDLLGKYNAADTNTTLDIPANKELAGDSLAVQSGRSLNKAEYYAEMSAANKRGATPAEIQEIKDARARGRAQGK